MAISQNEQALPVIRKWDLPFIKTDQASVIYPAARLLRVDLIVLAGWTRLLTIADDYRDRIINIHPSLLPNYGGRGFYGLKVHQAVLNAGEKMTGCTVHLVNNEYDRGRILIQQEVPVLEGDTAETLQERVKQVEREVYPQAIKDYWNECCQSHSGRSDGSGPGRLDSGEADGPTNGRSHSTGVSD